MVRKRKNCLREGNTREPKSLDEGRYAIAANRNGGWEGVAREVAKAMRGQLAGCPKKQDYSSNHRRSKWISGNGRRRKFETFSIIPLLIHIGAMPVQDERSDCGGTKQTFPHSPPEIEPRSFLLWRCFNRASRLQGGHSLTCALRGRATRFSKAMSSLY
jgi:hypothetical protein